MSQTAAPRTSANTGAAAFRTAHGPVRIIEKIADLDDSLRERGMARHCKDLRYYEIIERTLQSQFQQRFFVLENEKTGQVAVQPFFFVDQDLTAGLPANLRRIFDKIRRRWPRFLVMR
ncbi:MAG TPA: hypothetical protein VGH90_13005, partial [Chthoniobacteraceae bacterium]